MKYRNFGKMDWQASVLGFGCMRLPILGDKAEAIDEPQAQRMIRFAINHGVNYMDTAYPYHGGNSELFLGRALRDGYRQKVRLATKMPAWLVETAADFDKYLDDQLKRLQTEHIDLYLLHGLNRTRWSQLCDLGVRDWMPKAIASGRIGAIGFSFHDSFSIFKRIVDEYDGWDFCQIQYNYMDINEQAGTRGLKYAASKELAVVVMEPLLGGRLANPPESARKIFESAQAGRSPVDWALQWLWDKPEVSVVLSGMSTMQQVEENLQSAQKAGIGSFTAREQKVIHQIRADYRKQVPVPCTQCLYCVPCPNGVDIPRNFEIFNKGAMMEAWGSARFRYGQIPTGEKAESCQQCEECEEKCPQHIGISRWMKYVHEVLGLEVQFDRSRQI
jgi:predicted aldo/keto reductase-like oxidoreductase